LRIGVQKRRQARGIEPLAWRLLAGPRSTHQRCTPTLGGEIGDGPGETTLARRTSALYHRPTQ